MALRTVAAAILAVLCAAASAQQADEAHARLTFPNGRISFEIPIQSAGAMQITAELLDLVNQPLSKATGSCTPTLCRVDMPPAADDGRKILTNDLGRYRLRYTIGSTTGILAVDHIAPELYDLHLAVADRIRPGASYTARIRALHPLTGAPVANVPLTVTLSEAFVEDDKDDLDLAPQAVTTDAGGFASFSFNAPKADDLESMDLSVEGKLGGLRIGASQTLNVPSNQRFDLTTDKPLYQPGQTVHTRMLLLDRNGHAAPNTKVRVDIDDPDSTLVFRAEATTSAFGIATLDWPVPARMRLGQYRLQAELPDDSSSHQNAYASIRLSRYDLPTFVVAPQSDRTFYLPGQNADIDVHADYLFGQPVRRGHVRVVREDDRTWNFAKQKFDTKEGKAVTGELDAKGIFHAHIDLSADEKQYRDHDPSNNYTDLHYAAYVTDSSTGRTEQRRFDLRVTAQALHLTLSRQNQPRGLPGQYYLTATLADGTPVECDVAISLLPHDGEDDKLPEQLRHSLTLRQIHTDANGLARITLPEFAALAKQMPPALEPRKHPEQYSDEPTLYLAAADSKGHRGAITESLNAPEDLFRITTAKSLYRPGDPIDLALDSAQQTTPVTLQVFRHTTRGDLLLASRDLALDHGHAALTLPTDARFSGLIFIEVIALGTGTQSERGDIATHAILFPRDNSLHVGIQMSAATYKPGEEATAALTVHGAQDPDGDDPTPAPSALGLVAVDQAVMERNRTDNDFGGGGGSFFFRPSFFGTAGLFGNWQSAGGYNLAALQQLDMTKPLPPSADLAAEMLLSTENLRFETTDSSPSGSIANVYDPLIVRDLIPARVYLTHYVEAHLDLPASASGVVDVLRAGNIDLNALRDPWGDPYTIVFSANAYGQEQARLHSDGPDKQHGTADDFEVDLASWRWFAAHQADLNKALTSYHQRTNRYIRTLADLTAEMHAENIPFEQWRDPWNQPFTYKFSIQQTRYAIEAYSNGDPNHKPDNPYYTSGLYGVGTATIDYTAELRSRIEQALSKYVLTHPFPTNDAQFHAALSAAHVPLGDLVDPWRRPLYATYRSHSFYTDRVHTEAHATPNGPPEVRTTTTPVTAMSDILDLHSHGPHINGHDYPFLYASFSRIRTTQGAKEATPRKLPSRTVHNGPAGDIVGIVTDPAGAVIPGATIVAHNVKTGEKFEQQTDADGSFVIGPIPVGSYKLALSKPGFMDLIYDEISVLPGNTVTLEAKLNVGSESTTVEVNAQVVEVQTMNSTLGVSVNYDTPLRSVSADQAVVYLNGFTGGQLPPKQREQAPTPRLRDYFPETLLWRPEIITAPNGTATLKFPVADNITTWQLSAAVSTLQGNTGAGTAEFRTFQPFFAAFDPPSILTLGDTIALPITLRNYLDHPLQVTSSLTPAPWFKLASTAATNTTVLPSDSASPIFRFTAIAPTTSAEQEFTATATDTGDRIARPVTVHPNGKDTAVTAAAILAPGPTTLHFELPTNTLPGAGATLKLYPNFGAHVRDALARMADYPNGCAEQILSIAWPSLLLARYETQSSPPRDEKLAAQTHLYLEEAYENLLGNQLSDGGFAYWTRDSAADLALTAYAVEFLTQARAYITIDDKVLDRAVAYLAKEQQKDGRWIRIDRYTQKPLLEDRRANAMLTASIAAMIANAPKSEPLLTKAVAVLQPFVTEFDEPYTLASYAIAAIALKDEAHSQPAIARLRTIALSESGGAYWALESNTPFFGWGRAGRVESTAQVLHALLAAGAGPQDSLVARGLLFLDHEQDRHSLWYSTQATARVLDVLASIALLDRVPHDREAAGGGIVGAITLTLDGKPLPPIRLPAANEDSGPVFIPFTTALTAGTHAVTLTLPAASSTATAQIVANFYQPWPTAAPISATTNNEQLRLNVAFSSTTPAPGQPVAVTAHIERLGFRGYGMMIAEIGLPPGADVDRASLETAMTASGYEINHYEVLPDKVLFYLWPRAGGLTLRFRFTPRYGVDALTAPSSVYDYYNPDARFDLAPTHFRTR